MAEQKALEAPIIVPSEELYKLIDEAKYKLDFTGPKVLSLEFPAFTGMLGDTDLSLAMLINMKPSSRKAYLKEMANQLFQTLKKELRDKMEQIPETITTTLLQTIFNILEVLVQNFIEPFDEEIVKVLKTYNFLIRIYRMACDNTLDDVIRERCKRLAIDMLNQIMTQFPPIVDLIAIIMLIDIMKKTSKNLRDARKASPETVDDTIGTMQTTTDILGEQALMASTVVATILYFLHMLMPILAAIGAAFAASREFDIAEKEAEEEAYKNDETKPEPKKDKPLGEKIGSDIVNWAERNENGYSYNHSSTNAILRKSSLNADGYDSSLNGDSSTSVKESEDICLDDDGIDYMNACIVDRGGFIGDAEMAALDSPTKLVIELKRGTSYSISLKKKQIINVGDTIGYINGAKISSDKGFVVDRIVGNKIFGSIPEQSTDLDEIRENLEKMLTSAKELANRKTEFQEIVEKFSDLSKVEEVLREYFIYINYPRIPLNIGISTHTIERSKDTIAEVYTNHVDSIIEKHKNNVQYICGKDHAKDMVEQGKLLELKNEIINEKSRFFTEAFNVYENFLSGNSLFSTTDTEDYELLSKYMDIYYKIDYDENNDYSMELLKMLTDFISTRTKLESSNIEDAKRALNELCDSILRNNWKEKKQFIAQTYKSINSDEMVFTYDYFSVFDKMFRTNYFKSKQTNENASLNSEYKEMYDFLVSVMDAEDEEQKPIVADTSTMITDITSGTKEQKTVDVNKAKIREKIKEICRRFTIIKNIKEYREIHSEEYNNTDVNVRAELINQTKYEFSVLDAFYKKMKGLYLESKDLYDESTFTKFKTASIKRFTPVYYYDVKHEHYFVEPAEDASNAEDIADLYENPDAFNDLADTASSPYSSMSPFKFPYWLLYCMQATLVHCMLPMYWPCGLLIAGAPLPLPVIYIPIVFIPGSVSMLIGLGICGLAIWPMIVLLNFSVDTNTILVPINAMLDKIREMLLSTEKLQKNALHKSIEKKIEDLRKDGQDYDNDLRDIDIQINDLKEQILSNGVAIRRMNEERRNRRKEKKGK